MLKIIETEKEKSSKRWASFLLKNRLLVKSLELLTKLHVISKEYNINIMEEELNSNFYCHSECFFLNKLSLLLNCPLCLAGGQ